MFESLARFSKILVTGPQRAGTRICAIMIAFDTGHEYVDEMDIQMDSLVALNYFVRKEGRHVVHCPSLCRHIHHFSSAKNLIVFVRRPVKDIERSQRRIGRPGEILERIRYDGRPGSLARIQYGFWKEVQRKAIRNPLEIRYASLRNHPLWVSENRRGAAFHPTRFAAGPGLFSRLNPVVVKKPHTLGIVRDGNRFLFRTRPEGQVLNAMGSMVWRLCDGRRTWSELLQAVHRRFPEHDERTIARHLGAFLFHLLDRGFIGLASKKKPE